MSQRELAAALGTTQATISRWEMGLSIPGGPAQRALQHLADQKAVPAPPPEPAAPCAPDRTLSAEGCLAADPAPGDERGEAA